MSEDTECGRSKVADGGISNQFSRRKRKRVGQTEAAQRGRECISHLGGSKGDLSPKPRETHVQFRSIPRIVTAGRHSRSSDSAEPLVEAARKHRAAETSSSPFPTLAEASCVATRSQPAGDQPSGHRSRLERDFDKSRVACLVPSCAARDPERE